MRRVSVIGIGTGDPEDLTVKAIRALNEAAVLFLPAKGDDADALLRYRYEVCERYVERTDQRMVEIPDPKREAGVGRYATGVERWYDQRVDAWESALLTHLEDGEAGAFLAWGDPSLYDGTLRVLDAIHERGVTELEIDVVAGISAIHALTARHRTTLNQVGGTVMVTTGRELPQRWSSGADDVVVMLDPHCRFAEVAEPDTVIYWGAYLGSPDEILISGPVGECTEPIRRARSEAKERHGWVFDSYLLRRARTG